MATAVGVGRIEHYRSAVQPKRRGVIVAAVTFVVALMSVAGCGGGDDDPAKRGSTGPSADAATKVYEAGDSISVATGASFVVALVANPSTGYSWSAAPNPNATFVSSEQVPGGSRLGAPGTQRLTFRATAPGSSTLVLDYARPFEPGVPPVQTQSFPLTVKG